MFTYICSTQQSDGNAIYYHLSVQNRIFIAVGHRCFPFIQQFSMISILSDDFPKIFLWSYATWSMIGLFVNQWGALIKALTKISLDIETVFDSDKFPNKTLKFLSTINLHSPNYMYVLESVTFSNTIKWIITKLSSCASFNNIICLVYNCLNFGVSSHHNSKLWRKFIIIMNQQQNPSWILFNRIINNLFATMLNIPLKW